MPSLSLGLVTLTFDLWPWPSNLFERGTKHVFRVNLAQICSAVPEIFHTQTKQVFSTSWDGRQFGHNRRERCADAIGADPVGVQGSGPPQNFGYGVFYGLDSTNILLKEIYYQHNQHKERLCKPIGGLKCSTSVGHRGFAPDPTRIAYYSAPETPSWWRGKHPVPKNSTKV